MKNTHWSRLIACFLALVMLLALAQFAAYASEMDNKEAGNNVPESAPSGNIGFTLAPASYKTSIDVNTEAITTFSYVGVTEPAQMDPNVENLVQLTITGLDADPEITKDTTLVWNVPDDISIVNIESLSSAEVTGTVEGRTLQLTWLDEKTAEVTLTVPVIPHISVGNDLSGRYVLVTAGNVMLGAETYDKDGGRGKLTSYPVDVDGDTLRPLTTRDSVWKLTHVSGNYYTVYSETAGQYLRIYPQGQGGFSGSGSAWLESATEESAQKILVEKSGNEYTFQYPYKDKKYGLNNSADGKFFAGFASFPAENKNHYKFRLYSPSSVTDAPTVDLSGEWMLAGGGRFVSVDSEQSGRLDAVAYNPNKDGILIPNDNINEWTFEHVTRDWYYVHSESGYLNISSEGVSVSGKPQPLLARSNDGFSTFFLTDGQMDPENGNSVFLKRADLASFEKVNTTLTNNNIDNNCKMTRYNPGMVANDPVNISGSWAITTASSGAALIAEVKSDNSNKLESVPYMMTEDGRVFSREKEITLWTFNRVEGNWYTVTADDGSYLSIGNGALGLSSSPVQVFIQEYNGEYRLTAGNNFALNNSSNDPKKGYSAYGEGKAVQSNEWHTLRHVFTGAIDVLSFDANGGPASAVPAAITGNAGDQVVLPEMDASKNGAEFIGWYQKTNYYDKPGTGEVSTCRTLLKPGMNYTLPRGTTTLYAVYNTTSKNIRFGIRKDGVIQDEPNNYPTGSYVGHFWINDVRQSNIWIIDTDPTNSVNGYYLENNITKALNRVPTADEIKQALKKEGNIPFDPETQYIHWYVQKWLGNEWHIDGVIRNKQQVEITYDTNVSDPNERAAVQDMPGGYQVPVGSEVLIGAAQNSTAVLTPQREGYVFKGWNTAADGTGTPYSAGGYKLLTENLHLYAQWTDVSEGKMAIIITSDWPDGKPAYVGTRIKLTANLTGFDNKEYTLQWQHSVDQETWVDEPGATEEDFIFEVTETTGQYTWRVVARDVRDKE